MAKKQEETGKLPKQVALEEFDNTPKKDRLWLRKYAMAILKLCDKKKVV